MDDGLGLGRGGLSYGASRGGPGGSYHQGGYRGGGHGSGPDHAQANARPQPPQPAPEFTMKGNDFPALPGAGSEVTQKKVSENSDGGTASTGATPWGESNRCV